MRKVKCATGCSITAASLLKEDRIFNITSFGAVQNDHPVATTEAINRAIATAYHSGGGTVLVPAGEFKTYTIRLASNVNLYLEKGAVIRAARCEMFSGDRVIPGEGGNYDEPEVNPYVGLQDHGHTYFANSLVYGRDLQNVMIYGEGLFDGSFSDPDGYTDYALSGGDPAENEKRSAPGHRGKWFGNKGISLVDCKNIVLKDFSILNAGHFAILCEGVENMLVDSILADTIRDALDVDCCRDVTVVHSRFNSLTDDALVLKASFGAGRFLPIYNVLIEDCDVTGYDAGSVYAGTYSCDKLVATDRCGPTARVKLGTESTCGYELVTIRNIRFKRSRGFALEAVDTSDLRDILFTDSTMENVSSSPIFLRIGDRGRFPVTGNSPEDALSPSGNVRLDNPNWILPNTPAYAKYPALRYVPSYNYTRRVSADGCSSFDIVDETAPVNYNPANYYEKDGHFYAYRFQPETDTYEPDFANEIPADRLCLYANAVGCEKIAVLENIEISNITVRDADPRYPILLMGLDSSPIRNVTLSHIDVEYRGGLTMNHAVEQRQLNTNWAYSQPGARPTVQSIPWLVNSFFVKNEGLLPRMRWDAQSGRFVPDPYNVPELPAVYPEPSNWGILPAYGLYARHVDGLTLKDIRLHYLVAERRPAMVFDDVHGAQIADCSLQVERDIPQIVLVSNSFKRPTNLEYVPDYPYHTTDCDIQVSDEDTHHSYTTECVEVKAPAPGTPRDSLYGYPTCAVLENGWEYPVKTDDFPLPATVHRPYFQPIPATRTSVGHRVTFTVKVRNPLTDGTADDCEKRMWNGDTARREYTVKCPYANLTLSAKHLPDGAEFDPKTGEFSWTPLIKGSFNLQFVADDGVLPVTLNVPITVTKS